MIKPVYYHCTKWEDWQNGMFRTVKKEGDNDLFNSCVQLLSSPHNLKIQMQRVVDEWIISTEENLTKADVNRRAWLGWAACSIFCGAPDFITRQAWGKLTVDQQNNANLVADNVVFMWERKYVTNKGIGGCIQLEILI